MPAPDEIRDVTAESLLARYDESQRRLADARKAYDFGAEARREAELRDARSAILRYLRAALD